MSQHPPSLSEKALGDEESQTGRGVASLDPPLPTTDVRDSAGRPLPSYKNQVRSVIRVEDDAVSTRTASVSAPASAPAPSVTLKQTEDMTEMFIVAAHVVAVHDDSEDMQGVEMDQTQAAQTKATEDETHYNEAMKTTPTGTSTRKKYILIVAFLLLVGLVVGLAVALTGGEDTDDDVVDDGQFFVQAANNLDGTYIDQYFGVDIVMSKNGDRIAVASAGGRVQVYELSDNDQQWDQIGADIVLSSAIQTTNLMLADVVTSVAMSADGETIVVGYGDAGVVMVYRYNFPFWAPAGNFSEGGRYGSVVSMNAGGNVFAVGAPGFQNNTDVNENGAVYVYQLEADGVVWGQRGEPIVGISHSAQSVSLNAEGNRVAVTAMSNPDVGDFPVVQVYESNPTDDMAWTALGSGVRARTAITTGWYVDLNAGGDRMVVSNSYLQAEDYFNTVPDSLTVQAYDFVNGNWKLVGQNIHANATGPKSGYLVSLSDDGSIIAMGDPGTSTSGRSDGHAHLYKFDGEVWQQFGPDMNGEAAGDQFGFSVTISGDGTRFAAGAPFNRGSASNAGRVQVFEIPQNI